MCSCEVIKAIRKNFWPDSTILLYKLNLLSAPTGQRVADTLLSKIKIKGFFMLNVGSTRMNKYTQEITHWKQ